MTHQRGTVISSFVGRMSYAMLFKRHAANFSISDEIEQQANHPAGRDTDRQSSSSPVGMREGLMVEPKSPAFGGVLKSRLCRELVTTRE